MWSAPVYGKAIVCTQGLVHLHRNSPTIMSALVVKNGPVPSATCSTLLGES